MSRVITGLLEPVHDALEEGLDVQLSERDTKALIALLNLNGKKILAPWEINYFNYRTFHSRTSIYAKESTLVTFRISLKNPYAGSEYEAEIVSECVPKFLQIDLTRDLLKSKKIME